MADCEEDGRTHSEASGSGSVALAAQVPQLLRRCRNESPSREGGIKLVGGQAIAVRLLLVGPYLT
jgi:hypothetical protein